MNIKKNIILATLLIGNAISMPIQAANAVQTPQPSSPTEFFFKAIKDGDIETVTQIVNTIVSSPPQDLR